ncbi:hypothetical protein IAD21_01100 [Abditibacteriota bacterium]|nr:hypothetical protein IAD21_01100 [Abditibacteriota bacterium]
MENPFLGLNPIKLGALIKSWTAKISQMANELANLEKGLEGAIQAEKQIESIQKTRAVLEATRAELALMKAALEAANAAKVGVTAAETIKAAEVAKDAGASEGLWARLMAMIFGPKKTGTSMMTGMVIVVVGATAIIYSGSKIIGMFSSDDRDNIERVAGSGATLIEPIPLDQVRPTQDPDHPNAPPAPVLGSPPSDPALDIPQNTPPPGNTPTSPIEGGTSATPSDSNTSGGPTESGNYYIYAINTSGWSFYIGQPSQVEGRAAKEFTDGGTGDQPIEFEKLVTTPFNSADEAKEYLKARVTPGKESVWTGRWYQFNGKEYRTVHVSF